ncbi:MAG TPA: RodZ domain-containing protein [Actinomycetota bacterium]|nr:RodZ domain-containing protein [Actinomycetota bacterium]
MATPLPSRDERSLRPVEEPPPVGARLRAAREELGLSLEDVSQRTHIAERFLRALEEDAPLDTFPAPVYARFFLREYARAVGLDPQPLLDALEARHGRWLPGPEVTSIPAREPPRNLVARILLVGAVAGLLAIAATSLWPTGERAEPPGAAPASPRVTAAPSPQARAPRAPVQAPRGIRALLVATQRCWVRATVDGEVRLERTLEPGERATLRGQRALELVLGNAGGVELRVNGRTFETGGPGEVVHLAFRWQGGRLIQQRA